jgi:polysaccharide biosynthesis/export protein VpsN
MLCRKVSCVVLLSSVVSGANASESKASEAAQAGAGLARPQLELIDSQAAQIEAFLSTYKLGTGDVVSVRVFGEPELSGAGLRLTDTGTVVLPIVGEAKISGLTLNEASRVVADLLRGRYLVNPRVSVSVEQYRPFFINGQVRGPGAYPYQPGLTVRKASSLAGGLQDRASLRKIFVIRAGDTDQKPQRIQFDDLIFPGDIVTIEESFF